jgi:hypothetical protein
MRQDEQRSVSGGPRRARPPWQATALLVLGAWLVASPFVLCGFLDTTGTVSAALSGVLLLVTGTWARLARNPAPAYVLALAVGVWLLMAPTIWEFGDGASSLNLVPLVDHVEPTRAAIARMRWDSVGTGLPTIYLMASILLPRIRRPHIWAT